MADGRVRVGAGICLIDHILPRSFNSQPPSLIPPQLLVDRARYTVRRHACNPSLLSRTWDAEDQPSTEPPKP